MILTSQALKDSLLVW